MSQFQMRVAIVGNPTEPTVPFSEEMLARLKMLGFNTVQINIAWGSRPNDEPLNLEDLLDVNEQPDARQQGRFAEMARRAALAKSLGFRVLFHFGAPRVEKLYEVIWSEQTTDLMTNLNSIQREKIVQRYETLVGMLASGIPEIDDLLMYTFDQEAWLGNEFGNDPLAAGVPLAQRIPPFLNRLTAAWSSKRPEGRLWWEPWEISAGQIYDLMDDLPSDHFGLMLHSNIAEVQMANPIDRWFRTMALLCAERNLPICGEVFLAGGNEEVEPLQHAYAPALIWHQLHRLQDLGIYGAKEYYGCRPDIADDLNLAMAGIVFNSPDLPLGDALALLTSRYPGAEAPLLDAFASAEKGLALFPWDLTWHFRAVCRQHTEWHDYRRWNKHGTMALSPSWKSTRRALFMLTEDEPEHNWWLIEDIGLRCRHAAAAMESASVAYRAAADATGIAAFASASAEFARFSAVACDLSLHAEETLCAHHIRCLSIDGAVPEFLVKRMEAALTADVENQKHSAVVSGAVSEAPTQLAAFTADPFAYCQTHFI